VIDLTLNIVVLRLAALVFVVAIHGFAIAGVAVALGDDGPRHDGRLTLNPLAHLDLFGTLAGVLFLTGWMKPLDIDPKHLRPGRLGLVIVVVAGIAATLASVMLLRLARPLILPLLPDTASQTVFALIGTVGQLGLGFALLNLLPTPCLTGGLWLDAIAPAWRDAFRRSRPYCGLIVLAAQGLILRALAPVNDAITHLLRW
jgi:Zn-dependent protease